MNSFQYLRPSSLEEAYQLLEKYGEDVHVKAGGTDLLVNFRAGKIHLKNVLGLEKIQGLDFLREEKDGSLSIGSMVRVNAFSRWLSDQKKFPFLAEAALVLGSHQIRNLATVGGNLSNAKPSADLAPLLVCLESRVKIGSSSGTREMALRDFFVNAGKTALQKNELLLSIHIPPSSPTLRGIYFKHSIRSAMDCCVIGVGCTLNLEQERMEKVRIALGAVAPTPVRAVHVEQLLEGERVDPERIRKAAQEAEKDISPISDIRGSKEYRTEMIKVLVKRALFHLISPGGSHVLSE